MSTTMKATSHRGGGVALYWFPNGRVDISVRDSEQARETAVGVDRTDFLAAVAKECDVIVIDRAELPKVREENGQHYAGSAHRTFGDAAAYRQYALSALAIAEYLDAHPPVDEAQVEALAWVLADARCENSGDPTADRRDLARALLATGRIEVKP